MITKNHLKVAYKACRLQSYMLDHNNSQIKFQSARLQKDGSLIEEYCTTLVCHPEDFTEDQEIVIPIGSEEAMLIFEKAVNGKANIVYMDYSRGIGGLNDTKNLLTAVDFEL